MDKSVIKVLLDGLESSNAVKVLDSLIKMKSKLREECGMRSLVDNDGLHQLVALLSKPHEKILDAALSLLGDCCLKEECVLAMKPLNIAQPLVLILKTIAKDSIIGRSCRLMGNLAQNLELAEKFHNAGAVAALVSTIEGVDKSTNHATLIMAVRALRFLWMVKHRQSEMLTCYVARSVTLLLIAECEKANIISVVGVQQPQDDTKKITKQARDDLFIGMLKCLSMFTLNTDPRCADQIQGDGRGYRCLVALTKDFESLALHCISNLCKTPSARPILGASGAVECLVTYLSGIPDAELWPKRCAVALSLLCRESVNRQKLRLARGLRLVLAAARSRAHIAHATPALLHFRYDELGFRILLAEGLAALVATQLHSYLATMRWEHSPRPEPSEASDSGAEGTPKGDADSQLKRKQNATVCRMLKKARYVGSPQFSSQSLASTSCASSSTSPPRDDYSSFYTESFTSDIPSRWGSPSGDCSPDRGSDKSLLPFKWPSSWSPASSPLWCSSPKNSDFDKDSSDSEQSGHYSPVCSDVEEDGVESGPPTLMGIVLDPDEPEIVETLDNEVINYEIMDSVEENSDSEDILLKFYETADMNCEFPGSKIQINCIIGLLSRISHTNVYSKSYYTATPWTYDQSLTSKPQRQSVDSPTETTSPTINVKDLLVTKDFLDSFLEYMSKCKTPGGRVSRILLRLISIPTNLLRLLQNNLPRKLYELENKSEHGLANCISCKKLRDTSIKLQQQLRTIAESDYGIGEISYQLLKGSKEMKQVLAQNLPFILSSHKPLEKMLIECKLLDILMETHVEATATAVSRLAINLKIRNPKSNIFRMIMKAAKKLPAHVDASESKERLDNYASIIFQLDDLTIVETDKTFLCEQSDVFNAMLTGGFKEAQEKCVRLPFVSKASFEYLVTLLQMSVRSEPIPTFPLPDSLDTALETLILTDRFLLKKLCVFLSRGIIFFKMQPNNADKIYMWSLNEGMGFLCIEALAYMLTGEMSEKERWRLFENILKTEYKQQWLDDIENAMLRHSSSSYFVKM